MCSPTLAIAGLSAAAGVGQSVAGYIGASRQAKQQAAYQAQAAAAERQRFMQEQTSLRMRQAQEQEAVGREFEKIRRKSRQALSKFQELKGGVTGASVEATINDYLAQESARDRALLLRQQELGQVATELQLEQAGFGTQQRQIGINRPINRPSGLVATLGALQQGLGGYATGLQLGQMSGGGGGTAGISQTTGGSYRGGSGSTMAPGGYKLF